MAGEVLPGWNVIANYAYTETTVTRDSTADVLLDEDGNPVVVDGNSVVVETPGNTGKRLPNVPKHGGRLWTTYNFQDGSFKGLFLGGGITLRSQRQGDLANDFQLPGYATVDLVAGYKLKLGKSSVTAQLNVNNLLDKDYFESSADFSRARIAPGAPQSFLGSIRVEF